MTINRVQESGFAQISNTALRDTRLSFKARGLLAMVLSHAGTWDTSRDWLIEQSDKDGRDAVQSALNELTELGYRRVAKEQLADGTFRTIVDWFHTPEEDGSSDRRVSRPSVEAVVNKNTISRTQEELSPSSPTAESGSEGGPTIPFSFQSPLPLSHSETGSQFDEFWALYPKKVAKEAARKAFPAACKMAPFTLIMERLRWQCQMTWDGKDRQYIPNASTWLNQCRWEDEAPQPTRTRASGRYAVIQGEPNQWSAR